MSGKSWKRAQGGELVSETPKSIVSGGSCKRRELGGEQSEEHGVGGRSPAKRAR